MEIVDGSQRMRTLRRVHGQRTEVDEARIASGDERLLLWRLSEARKRKFNARTLRGIVLENATTTATRTEMFARINTGGRSANDAEIRRGSLPGVFTDLVIECSRYDPFVKLTPISQRLINARERPGAQSVRFFCFLETYDAVQCDLPGWRDRPREFIFEFVETANRAATVDPALIERLKDEFGRMVKFVGAAFRHTVFERPWVQDRSRALAMKRSPSGPASHSGSVPTCWLRRYGQSTGQAIRSSGR